MLAAGITGSVTGQTPEKWQSRSFGHSGLYGAGTGRAHALLKGRKPEKEVTVALIGYGIDVSHKDVKRALWVNPAEKPNGKDDDRDGRIDDIHGWNFLGTAAGATVNKLSREGDREFLRLKDEHAEYLNLLVAGDKVYRYNPLTGLLEETAFPDDRQTFEYFRRVVAESEIGQTCLGVMLAKAVVAFMHEVDRELRRKHPGRPLTQQDFRAIDKRGASVLEQNLYGLVELMFLSSGSDSWDITLQYADTKYVAHQQQQYDRVLKNKYPQERRLIGDNPLDPADTHYGNNNLLADNAGHGTMQAGIIAETAAAGHVKVMALRVDADDFGESYVKDVALAIRYAVDKGADIIQLGKTNTLYPQPHAQWVDEALQYAAQKGVLVVIPMMDYSYNLDDQPFYPNRHINGGDLPTIITVAASDSLGNPYPAANFSKTELDLFAPGVDISAAYTGGAYATGSGSGFAATMVTGVAALIKSYFPAITPAGLRQLLMRSVTTRDDAEIEKQFYLYKDGQKDRLITDLLLFTDLCASGGILNAEAAVQLMITTAAQTQQVYDTIPFDIVQEKFIFTATINGKPARLILDTGGQNLIVADSAAYYGVNIVAGHTIAGIGNATTPARLGTVDDLRIGRRMHWRAGKVTVAPNNQFFRDLGVAGILGGEAFSQVCLSIDKRNKRFTIAYPFRPNKIPRSAGAAMKMGSAFHAIAPVTVGGERLDVLFDTGMQGFLSLGAADFEKLRAHPGNIIEVQHTGYGILYVGIAGIKGAVSDSIYKVRIPELTLPGGMAFHNVGALVMPHATSIAGQKLFDYGTVMLDYPRGLFYFFPYDTTRADVAAETKVWNTKILPMAGHFEVVAVIGHTGLAVGERVWAINGADLATQPLSETAVDTLLGGHDTATVTVGHDKATLRTVIIKQL
jgi:subtilisin family serine protease